MSRPKKFVPVDLPGDDDVEQMTEEQLHREIRALGDEPRRPCLAFYDEHFIYNDEDEITESIPMSAEERQAEDQRAREMSMSAWRHQIHRIKLEKKLWGMDDKQLWPIVEQWESKVFHWREGKDFTVSAKRQTPREQLIRRCADAIWSQQDHPLNPRRKDK